MAGDKTIDFPIRPRHDVGVMSPLRPTLLFVSALIALPLAGCGDAEPVGGAAAEADASPRAWRDRLTHLTDFTDGEGRGVVAGDGRLTIDGDGTGGYPRRGSWTSPVVPGGFGVTELLPSWNVDTPPGTGVRFSARTRDAATGDWSPWLDYGYWGEVPPPAHGETFDGGRVEIDILKLDRPADAWQVRAFLFAADLDATPVVRRVSVAARGPGEGPADYGVAGWSGDLGTPFVPQRDTGRLIGHETCSPTSTTMAMRQFGLDVDLRENALRIHDREHDLFGNWNRAVARAGEAGLQAHLERFDAWPQVAGHLAAGRPVIVTVRYGRGEAPSLLVGQTSGHLILIRGLTPDGDAIVNDPASADRGEAAIYKKADLERAWLQNAGGVGYVIGPPAARAPDGETARLSGRG